MKKYWFEKAYLPTGWDTAVTITVDETGLISNIKSNQPATGVTAVFSGLAIPGFPNVHSHAFQRAMAGLSEMATSATDTFWTWRKVMYRYAHIITPEDQEIIANQLYMEMLKSGYTSVAEFHYLHHQQDGRAFDNIATMSNAILNAAQKIGIRLTHLPVLYMSSDFGNIPLKQEQSRFANSITNYQDLLTNLHKQMQSSNTSKLGIALHSLRAVPPAAMLEALTTINKLDNTSPIHIHIAEQQLEVDSCIRWSGKRPVEWLFENHAIDKRWCLIHATHLNDDEITEIAQSGATVGICPTTEANLGDGIFPMYSYLQQGGRFAIGSDSNTSVSPIEELRWLEYGQRLLHQQRNVITTKQSPNTGQNLINQSLLGGAQALAQPVGALSCGYFADILVLDKHSPQLYGKPMDNILDSLVFNGNTTLIRDVIVGGTQLVQNYRYMNEQQITHDYLSLINKLQKN